VSPLSSEAASSSPRLGVNPHATMTAILQVITGPSLSCLRVPSPAHVTRALLIQHQLDTTMFPPSTLNLTGARGIGTKEWSAICEVIAYDSSLRVLDLTGRCQGWGNRGARTVPGDSFG
jgi:hypothetical protein